MPGSQSTPALWEIRAIQLDLARQRETVSTLIDFGRFAARWGFNTLFLYLEGVVRTRGFPYRPAGQSYSPDDIRRIVSAAEQAGLTVVPCIATLGHAEHFVQCEQLAHLAEATPDGLGGPMFCPSEEGTYEFLQSYLQEIAELFPAGHLHIGCDEAWALGACPRCRARLEGGERWPDLLTEHIKRMCAMLRPLGKRVWIWDDLLEYFSPEQIAALPGDVVMCAWQYDAGAIDLSGVEGHFDGVHRRDNLALYEQLGFDALVCPAADRLAATMAFTRYGRRHRVLGGLQTLWELSTSFLPAAATQIAFTGQLWAHPEQSETQALEVAIDGLLPNLTASQRLAVSAELGDSVVPVRRPPSPQSLLHGPVSLEEVRSAGDLALRERVLGEAAASAALPGTSVAILEQLHTLSRTRLLMERWRVLLSDLVDPRLGADPSGRQRAAFDELLNQTQQLAILRGHQWEQLRPGIAPDAASPVWERAVQEYETFVRQWAGPDVPQAMLDVRLFLWEGFANATLVIELESAGQWQEVFQGTWKPRNLRLSHDRMQLPLDWRQPDPTAVRLSVSGFGGQGVSFVEFVRADHILIPTAVRATSGLVDRPEAALEPDPSVCYLGSTDVAGALLKRCHQTVAMIELGLGR